jgi:hypothetical protein
MQIVEIIEHKEQKKPKQVEKPAVSVSTVENLPVRTVVTPTFKPSIIQNVMRNQARSAVTSNLAKFVAVKERSPGEFYAGVDRHMDHSNPFSVKKIYHAKVGLDHRLFYAIKRTHTEILLILFGVFTHDHSGIGSKANRNVQDSLANKFDRDRAEEKFENLRSVGVN